jgi:hypothetical protein
VFKSIFIVMSTLRFDNQSIARIFISNEQYA